MVEAGLNFQGPQAAAVLRDWGADVIKVELPGVGDQSRSLPAAPDDERSGYFIACNQGKRSVTIDLRQPAGSEVFLRLTEKTDVVITNFRPGTMESWGLGYEGLAERNSGVIYGMGSTFGPRGPDAQREGTRPGWSLPSPFRADRPQANRGRRVPLPDLGTTRAR